MRTVAEKHERQFVKLCLGEPSLAKSFAFGQGADLRYNEIYLKKALDDPAAEEYLSRLRKEKADLDAVASSTPPLLP